MTRRNPSDLQRDSSNLADAIRRTLPFAGAMLAGAGVAQAQQSEDVGLEEVVVSAQKRTESLQDVPLSIQAIGQKQLAELKVDDFADYVKFLPNVSYQTGGPGFARPYLRGVASGENANHSGPLPSVGVYLDEQPITTITGPLDVQIYDIARVEVLAGPQGTLYGASSQAGTLRIISNKPDASEFAAGYANRIPCGALLLVSDQPMILEGIKTELSDARISADFVERHIQIGIEASRLIRRHGKSVRHLRFDE